MTTLDPALIALLQRAESLVMRLETLLPSPQHAVAEPDWSASVAFRYRKRSGKAWAAGRLEPVRHVAHISYALAGTARHRVTVRPRGRGSARRLASAGA